MFARDRPNELWLTDITEHPTNEGKVYCCVVLDTFSRLVVGWASTQGKPPCSSSTRSGWRRNVASAAMV
ncbi:MAG: DDE-type integrase/transposase/recombinase [Solirubrobacteraceae bacterium]